MSLTELGNEKLPSIIKDPFNKLSVERVLVCLSKNWSGKGYTAHGHVEFKNGNTIGKQEFDGETFDEVVLKIKAMLDNL